MEPGTHGLKGNRLVASQLSKKGSSLGTEPGGRLDASAGGEIKGNASGMAKVPVNS